MPSRRQSSEMFSSPRSPSSTMRIFSSLSTAGGSDAECPPALVLPAHYPARISASSSLLAATMNQKSSLREVPRFVSWAMTGNHPVVSRALHPSVISCGIGFGVSPAAALAIKIRAFRKEDVLDRSVARSQSATTSQAPSCDLQPCGHPLLFSWGDPAGYRWE